MRWDSEEKTNLYESKGHREAQEQSIIINTKHETSHFPAGNLFLGGIQT